MSVELPGQAGHRVPLPLMKSWEDAVALCQREKDPFYLDAFMIEEWLGRAVHDAWAEYAEKKHARQRCMQTGQAWRRFLELFGHAKDGDFPYVLHSILRFAEYDDVQSRILWRAKRGLFMEGGPSAVAVSANGAGLAQPPETPPRLMRRTVKRWCDWVDAVFHWQVHFLYHVIPASLDPDGEKRELASLGLIQRAFPDLNDFSKAWWEWHHSEAAERFKGSPKWPTLGKIMAAPLRDDGGPAAVDQIGICLWPLVIRHNWTYRDLMTVMRKVLPAPHRYPLEREQDLAAYCPNVLGLRKRPGPPGRSSTDGCPPGCDVALRLCCPGNPS